MVKKVIEYIVFLAFFISVFCFFSIKKGEFFYTDSKSMEPTIRPGDRMILIKSEALKRGDIIIFKNPKEPKQYLVKRLIGLPGDTVEVAGRQFYLNGKPMDEPYLKESFIVYKYGLAQVPPDKLFMLGDNRNNSNDSSVWGFLPAKNTRGKVIFRYWPPNRFGRIQQAKPAIQTEPIQRFAFLPTWKSVEYTRNNSRKYIKGGVRYISATSINRNMLSAIAAECISGK